MKDEWSEKEISILRDKYGEIDNKELSKLLPKRNIVSIRNRASKLGFAGEQPDYWSEEEIKKLKEGYRLEEKQKLLNKLPKRSWKAIKSKARDLNLSRTAVESKIANKKLNLKDEDAAYIAGVVNCDGSITIYKANHPHGDSFQLKPEIKVSNNSRELIDRVADKTPSTQITEDKRSGCNYLSIEGKGCLPLAREIEDHLTAKKEQCKKLIQWCESRLKREKRDRKYIEKEIQIHEEIQNLNSGQ